MFEVILFSHVKSEVTRSSDLIEAKHVAMFVLLSFIQNYSTKKKKKEKSLAFFLRHFSIDD